MRPSQPHFGTSTARPPSRPGRALRDWRRGRVGRQPEIQGRQALSGTARRGREGHRRSRSLGGHARSNKKRAPHRRRFRVRVHGRIDGVGGGGALRARRARVPRPATAARVRHGDRRRAHAGRAVFAPADGEDHRRFDATHGAQAPVHYGSHRPDHGRGVGKLRHDRRHRDCRAACAHRFRGTARHRADRTRETPRRLSARRVLAGEGCNRHDRRPAPDARQARESSYPPAAAGPPGKLIAGRRFMPGRSLPEWLDYIERIHPKSVQLGLERVAKVRDALGRSSSAALLTVAGTNGKGSTCAMLEAILLAAGYRVGLYTSPHLLRYNERVRIDGVPSSDTRLCAAFEAVERARGEITLTYFEFGTLAAWEIFAAEALDAVILEVGLGGRLDAVNAFDADCALLTSVGLDHTDYLGDTRERVGYEKAGIFRGSKPAIVADRDPPRSVLDHADAVGVDLWLIGRDFGYRKQGQQWMFWGRGVRR